MRDWAYRDTAMSRKRLRGAACLQAGQRQNTPVLHMSDTASPVTGALRWPREIYIWRFALLFSALGYELQVLRT